MIKRLSFIFVFACLLCGCYDHTDIEDIKNVALIIADTNKISYCTITTEPEEKSYGYKVYNVATDDLYYGLNSIGEQTGKEVSLSHLEAIMFSKECDYQTVKKTINSLLEGTNSHPKIMTAFLDGDSAMFFDRLNIPADTSVNKLISNVFYNRFESTIECSAMDLSCAINFDVAGKAVPVVFADEEGNIKSTESVFVNNYGFASLDMNTTQFLNAIDSKEVYINYNNINVPVECQNIKFTLSQNSIDCDAVLKIRSGSDSTTKQVVSDFVKAVTDDIIFKKNEGFDLLNMQGKIVKEFRDIPSFEKYIQKNGGVKNWLKNINLNIEIGVK